MSWYVDLDHPALVIYIAAPRARLFTRQFSSLFSQKPVRMSPRKRKHSPSPQPSSPAVPHVLRRSDRRRQQWQLSPSFAREVSSQPSITATSVAWSEQWDTLRGTAINRVDKYELDQDNASLKRRLKALLEWLPEGGRDSLAHDIRDATSDEQLHDVYDNLYTCLLAPIKAAGGQTPRLTDSPHSKRTEHVNEEYQKMAESAKREKGFRSGCLDRDNFHCVVTNALEESKWVEQGADPEVVFGPLEGAHIIPYFWGEYTSEPEQQEVSKMWECIHRCFPATKNVIRPSTINDLRNGLSLHKTLHFEFGRFQCAFKRVPEKPNTYEFVHFSRFAQEMRDRVRQMVTFRAAEGFESLPLPSPALLECHHTLAQVFNLTGMGEEIDLRIQRWKDLKEEFSGRSLAADGSTDVGSLVAAGFWDVGAVPS